MRSVILLTLGLIIGTALIFTLILANQEVQTSDIGAAILKTQQPVSQTIKKEPTPSRLSAMIEGSISYPSEGIPQDLKVCAETLQGYTIACTDKHINDSKYTYGVGYSLELIPGDYYIYATAPSTGDYRAYYNEFVTCGLAASCNSHNKIKVSVNSGDTLTDVDPQDWYNEPTL